MAERASETIEKRLRKMIITRELAPGQLVSEAQLADQLGCSRTPLREALWQLRYKNLVEIPPRRGILIPQLSIVDFQQAHEAMLVVGSAYIRLTAEHINERQLEQMRGILAEQERANEAGEPYSLTELDYRFHTLIAEATGNRYFAHSADVLHSSLARFIYPAYEATGSIERSIAEHRQIAEALEIKDAELARLRLREHTTQGRRRVLSILGLGVQSEQL